MDLGERISPGGPFRRFAGKVFRRAYWALAACMAALLFCPTNYVIERPGPTMNLLGSARLDYGSKKEDLGGQAVTGVGSPSFSPSGSLYMVTVDVAGSPSSPVPAYMALAGYFDPHSSVLPEEAVFPAGSSLAKDEEGQAKLMEGAKAAAKAAAASVLKSLGRPPSAVEGAKIASGPVGGPSAGLAFALALVEKAEGEDLTGGKAIAATGALSGGGKVKAVGGVSSKLIAASRSGASYFLLPEANCNQAASRAPRGLKIVPVSSLSGALLALRDISSGALSSLPSCRA